MPRLFTGLAVPAEIAEALKIHQGGLPGARWIEPGDFHVTLRFLGDVEATVADDVVEAPLESVTVTVTVSVVTDVTAPVFAEACRAVTVGV